MPNSSTTVAVDSSTTTNAAVPLCYGPVWVTGKRLDYYELQNTGNDNLDYTRVGLWLLGEGEWDGCHELWINDNLVWTSEFDDLTQFHFHRGADATIGAGLNPSSVGPDQGVDSFFSQFPTAVTPLALSRIAYYAIMRKQPIQNQTNTHQDDPTQWADINPIGLWRSTRVRLFDDEGNQTAYAYSTNPAWHFVDAILRKKIFPEYNIDLNAGIDQISAAAQNRFDWGAIYSAAQYFDGFLLNGRRRFEGVYAFSQTTTLAAILEQMLKCCRSFMREYAGKISLVPDQTRASVFTFSRNNTLPGSPCPSDKAVSGAPNCYVGKFRDLLIPTGATIASIACSDHQNPEVTTEAPHPFNQGDFVAIGGTGTIYDGTWIVATVPDTDDDDELDTVTTLTLTSKGSNYPSAVGSGGSMGLLYSRLKERAPQFDHQNNQYARGAVGVGLPRQRNRFRVEYDYSTSTFDQVYRITTFERDLALGSDVSPYVTPRAVTLKAALFARDAAGSGAVAAQIQCGDRVTLDNTANYAYAGDYTVSDIARKPYNATASASGGSIQLTADADGGELELTLGPYLPSDAYDVSDPAAASWSNVPGSDPGNNGSFTAIALADDGQLAFLTGSVTSGNTFDLPSTGFSPSNVLDWVGPQGYVEGDSPMQIIQLCEVDENRFCTLDYFDGDNIWHGDMNFACATWLGGSGSAAAASAGAFEFEVFTLAGGEEICFGKGIVAHGTAVELPTGFVSSQMFAVAYPHDGNPDGDNDAHWVGAYVDESNVVNLSYKDGEGNVWHGNASVLIFAWKNNSGEVATQTVDGEQWMTYANSDGFTLGVGLGTNMANGSTFALPTQAGAGDSLQIIAGSHGWDYPDNGHHAHGIGACYVDSSLAVNMVFEDGEGNVWPGTADVFALFYEPTGTVSVSPGGITVTVSPAAISLALSGIQQYSAYVGGTSTTTVTWSVDGVDGGNGTVGTIDDTGLYTAPADSGTHVIKAVSTENIAAFGTSTVIVGSGTGTGGAAIGHIVVSPLSVSVPVGAAVGFTAYLDGAETSGVDWLVNGIAGGNSTLGFVTSGGIFTPVAIGEYAVIAQLSGSPGVAGAAWVSVGL
jgi:hypothetical protein